MPVDATESVSSLMLVLELSGGRDGVGCNWVAMLDGTRKTGAARLSLVVGRDCCAGGEDDDGDCMMRR